MVFHIFLLTLSSNCFWYVNYIREPKKVADPAKFHDLCGSSFVARYKSIACADSVPLRLHAFCWYQQKQLLIKKTYASHVTKFMISLIVRSNQGDFTVSYPLWISHSWGLLTSSKIVRVRKLDTDNRKK